LLFYLIIFPVWPYVSCACRPTGA